MTNDAFDNPDHVASVDETVERVKNTRIDLFGGPVFAVILCGLLIIAGLLDTFGLDVLMSIHPKAPMMFRSLCSSTVQAGSGGFALLFIGALLIAMSALQVLAPRSVRYGFAFLIFTAVVAQFFVVWSGSLHNVTGYGASGDPTLIGEFWRQELGCDGGTLSRAANYRYNPVLDGGSGGSLGVPERFTTMLAANLGLLVGFGALALVSALIAAIFRIFRKPERQAGPINGIFGFFARGPVERAIIVQTAALTVLAVILGPILIMFFANRATDGTGVSEATQSIQNILWIGPVVFLVDLARVALWSPEPEAEEGFEPAPVASAPDLILPPVVTGLRGLLSDQVVTDYTLSPLPGARRVPEKVFASDFDDGDDVPWPSEGALHFETLTNWHYDLIIETMNRRVFDRGRTAVLICPVDVIANVQEALEAGFAKNPGPGIVNWWSYGDPQPTERDLDLVLVSPESLESLVEEVFDYQEFFWLLGGVFALNLHRMDLGLLHVSMKRLERHVRSASDMVAILQSEHRRKLPDWIKNLPLLVQMSTIARKQRPEVNESIPQHVALLSPKSGEDFSTGRSSWPVGLRALIHTSKSERRALPYMFDVHTQHVRSFWNDTIIQTLRNDGEETTVAWARGLQVPVLVPSNHPHPVAYLSDQANLVNMLSSDIGTPGALEALRLITVGGYPGAAFLADSIKQELRGAASDADRRHAITRLQERLGSIAPAPQGGPVELALMVRQEFKSATRANVGGVVRNDEYKTLTQERISAFWDKSSPALQQLRISNTKAGLEKLFQITLRPQTSGEMLTGTQTDHRSYEYKLTERATRDIDAMAMLELSIQDPKSGASGTRRPERLLLSDHGLSYAKGTRLALAGRIYEVEGVESRNRRLRVRYSEDSPALPYTFVRDYGILTTGDDESGFAADELKAWMTRKAPHEIASGYLQVARRTRATYQHTNLWKPFDGIDTAPARVDVDAESPLQLRSAAILRLLTPDTRSTGRGRGIGRSRGRIRRGGGDVQGSVAFTLATTLQDVLQMCFPANAHRIAVLSPQAALENHDSAVEQFARLRQPMLRVLDGAGHTVAERRRTGPDHGLDPRDVSTHAKLAGAFFDRARAVVKGEAHEKTSLLHLFIVEDSDHDIGVAKALTQSDVFVQVLAFWRDYLEHCVNTKGSAADSAYGFGAGKIAQCFDFDGALMTLNDMIAEDD